MKLNSVAASLSLLTFAHAWPWPHPFGGDLVDAGLFRRQNTATPSQTASSPKATQSGSSASSQSQSNTASITLVGTSIQSLSPSATSNGGGNGTTVFDPRDPAGGISMITPNVVLGAQYYKIGDWVHFKWNYTSLQATPTAVNVVATCTQNQATYTIASNQSVGDTGEVYWDTGAYQSSASIPLLTNEYTLIVWDAAQAITARPQAGYLAANEQFVFGMYTPQPYTPWSEYSCPTCNNSGASALERMTLTFLLGMCSITVLTFTWFTSSLSL